MIYLFKLFLLDFVLLGCMFLKTCPFASRSSSLLACNIHSILLYFFCIFAILVIIYPHQFFVSLFLWVLSFFVEPCWNFVKLFTISKNQLLVLFFFFYFLISIFFIFFLIFFFSFLLFFFAFFSFFFIYLVIG